jgi:hypothetical protein
VSDRIERRLAEIEAGLAVLAAPAISPELRAWLAQLTNDEALAERIAEAVEARLAGLDVASIL